MNYSLTERHVETGRPNKSKEENGTGKVQEETRYTLEESENKEK